MPAALIVGLCPQALTLLSASILGLGFSQAKSRTAIYSQDSA
jgi:hypothetical protein